MALRYVSPTGAQPSGYDNYYTEVGAALNATANGDTVVLEKSLNHVLLGTLVNTTNESWTMRNEDNDESYDECVITVANNSQIRYSNNTATRHKLTIKGITFAGPQGGYAEWNPPTGETSFMRFIGALNTDVVFDSVKWTRLRWALLANGQAASRGLAFTFSPTSGASTLLLKNCHMDDLQADSVANTTGWNRAWYIADVANVKFMGCTFSNLGKSDRTSGLQGSFGKNGIINMNIQIERCHWTDIYCNDAGTAATPDGSAFCSSFDESAFTETYTVSDCTFTRCSSGKSGAFHIGRNARGYVNRCIFTDCVATGTLGGGAVGRGGQDNANLPYGKTYYTSCLFKNCSAPNGDGGAIVTTAPNPQITVDHCTFDNCRAGGDGQAIYAQDLESAYVTQQATVKNCVFINTTGADTIMGETDSFDAITDNFLPGGDDEITDGTAVPTGTLSGVPGLEFGYYPQASSQLIGAATHAGYIRDADGNYFNNPPSVGAYEVKLEREGR